MIIPVLRFPFQTALFIRYSKFRWWYISRMPSTWDLSPTEAYKPG